MTDRKQALIDLRDKVKAGEFFTGPSSLAQEVFGIENTRLAHSAYHGSLDAAKALHEAVLPGWDWLLNSRCNYAHVWEDKETGDADVESQSLHSPARAWLLAILEALIAREDNA